MAKTRKVQVLGSLQNSNPDWNQTDETKPDYIKNKPDEGEIIAASVQDNILIIEQNPGIVAKGNDGHTPIKGTDYFTDAEKAEIISATKPLVVTWTDKVNVDSDDPDVTLQHATASHSASEILAHINNGGIVVLRGGDSVVPYHRFVNGIAIFENTFYNSYTDAVMTHKNAYFVQISVAEDKTVLIKTSKLTSDCIEGSGTGGVTEDRVNELINEALANIPNAEDLSL